jgi:hypothetical protein
MLNKQTSNGRLATYVTQQSVEKARPWNTNGGGRICTVDLLIKVDGIVKNNIFSTERS